MPSGQDAEPVTTVTELSSRANGLRGKLTKQRTEAAADVVAHPSPFFWRTALILVGKQQWFISSALASPTRGGMKRSPQYELVISTNSLAAARKRRNEPKPPLGLSQLRKGAPCSRQRTWVWQAGRSPSKFFLLGSELMLNDKQNLFLPRTGANPDFLSRWTRQSRVCAFPQRKAHELHQRHQPPQEIRGSAVERSAVSPTAPDRSLRHLYQ